MKIYKTGVNIKVDKLLDYTYKLQRGNFTNACLVVCATLHKCFNTLNIKNKIIYGYIDGTHKIPHVWIETDDNIIDVTYVEDIDSNKERKKWANEYKSNPDVYKKDIDIKEKELCVELGERQQEYKNENHNVNFFRTALKDIDSFINDFCTRMEHLNKFYNKMITFAKLLLSN